jgi:hypothetical protein
VIFHSSEFQIVQVFLCRLWLRILSELWNGDLLEGSVLFMVRIIVSCTYCIALTPGSIQLCHD